MEKQLILISATDLRIPYDKTIYGEVIAGVRAWLNQAETGEPFKTNYEKFVRRLPGGYVDGVPVVG